VSRDGVRVVRGDITTLAVDAVVTAANSALAGGGGVDGAIHRAAGPELLAACRELGGCPTGEARITPGFQLVAKHCIHAVGPVWSGGDADEEVHLAGAYRMSLNLAAEAGCGSLAFPAISCGVYGYPIHDACRLSVSVIRRWMEAHDQPSEVLLCAFGDDVASAWERALHSTAPLPKVP